MNISQNVHENKLRSRPAVFGLIDRALQIEPNLRPFGFRSQPGEHMDELYNESAILACLRWLATARKTDAVNMRTTAYRWKHRVELPRSRDYQGYVPEGVLIAVAIALGVKWTRVGSSCYLAISERGRSH